MSPACILPAYLFTRLTWRAFPAHIWDMFIPVSAIVLSWFTVNEKFDDNVFGSKLYWETLSSYLPTDIKESRCRRLPRSALTPLRGGRLLQSSRHGASNMASYPASCGSADLRDFILTGREYPALHQQVPSQVDGCSPLPLSSWPL